MVNRVVAAKVVVPSVAERRAEDLVKAVRAKIATRLKKSIMGSLHL